MINETNPKTMVFVIPGRPRPQKQTKHGKGSHWDPSKKDANWIKWNVYQQCRETLPVPLECAIYAKWVFSFVPPKSTSKKRLLDMLLDKIKHKIRPDGSNCHYLAENALKGIVYKDDSQICHYEVIKKYAEKEETTIIITRLE